MISRRSVDELWVAALADVLANGDVCAPRGKTVREVRGRTLVLEHPERNVLLVPSRKLNYHFMLAEWMWILSGRADVASISRFNKNIAQFSDDGVTFFGAYGRAVTRDLEHVVALLRRDPDSRQAIVSPWRPESLTTPTKDVPCTLAWQFFVRGGAVELHVSMRSNDLWLGFPYDVFTFTQTQRLVADALGLRPGKYYHHVGSLHLYEQHFGAAHDVLRSPWGAPHPLDREPLPTPTWPVPANVARLLDAVARDPATGWDAFSVDLPRAWRAYMSGLMHRFQDGEKSELCIGNWVVRRLLTGK